MPMFCEWKTRQLNITQVAAGSEFDQSIFISPPSFNVNIPEPLENTTNRNKISSLVPLIKTQIEFLRKANHFTINFTMAIEEIEGSIKSALLKNF